MKRISRIEVENSRAYYDRISFSLEKGENLLLYGENGSGKTSLYKSLNDFIQSFYSQVAYTQNRYKPTGAAGEVLLRIGEFDPATQLFANEVDYRFGDSVDNTNVQNTGYLKALALSKGFLNYRDLLKMYLYDEDTPNLFDFFVLNLLKHHVPLAQGMNKSIIKEWEGLNDDLFEVYNRNENRHGRGLNRLQHFDVVLRAVLDDLFEKVNQYLSLYFDGFDLQIGYQLNPLEFDYHNWKWEWEIKQDLRLKIQLGQSQINGYTEGLNEARLSAIAICLYLAALRANPGNDLRLMFLDDIFIGIDSANRLPILEILNDEFQDFQIVMATYDRSWYCMAKNYITSHAPGKWKFTNLFTLSMTENGQTFTIPVMTSGVSTFDRAKEYLHGQRDIDLPASANYFRKTLEELFSRLPKELYVNDDFTIIPGFKLTQRAEAVGKLFALIGEDTKHISFLETYLHPLIHPLSHYDEEAQIYRGELMGVEQAINGLMGQIDRFPHKCGVVLGKESRLVIKYDVPGGSYCSNYFISLEENLWLYKDNAGNHHFTDAKCHMVYMTGILNGKPLKPFVVNPKQALYPNFCYSSLDDALQKIYDYEVNTLHHAVTAHNDYDIVFRCTGKTTGDALTLKRDRVLAAM